MIDLGAQALRIARPPRDDGGALPPVRELDGPRALASGPPKSPDIPKAPDARAVQTLHTGPIHSSVAGRTDHLPVHVPSGSFVIPADVVSGEGQGNSMAGFKIMRRIFSGAPYSGAGMPYGQNSGPYMAELPKKAAGGPMVMRAGGSVLPRQAGGAVDWPRARLAFGGRTEGVPCIVAGGEFVAAPHEVAHVGGGDIEAGHKVLDDYVVQSRAKLIKTLKGLPGPRHD